MMPSKLTSVGSVDYLDILAGEWTPHVVSQTTSLGLGNGLRTALDQTQLLALYLPECLLQLNAFTQGGSPTPQS